MAIAGVSRRTVYNWLAAGKLDVMRTAGGPLRIFTDSLFRPHAHPSHERTFMTIKIIPTTSAPGKLADAELHFTDGPLAGLRLIGFGVWERRGGSRSVTFPARSYAVNGERRSFALLRPIFDSVASDGIRDLVLAAYAEHELAPAATTEAQ